MKKSTEIIFIATIAMAFILVGVMFFIEQSKTLTKWTNNVGSAGISWNYEAIPDENIRLFFELHIPTSPIGGRDYWQLRAVKPGKTTICWFRYTGGNSLDADNSYAQDYIIEENLKITEVGEPYPIWKAEECKAVAEHIERVRYSLEERLNNDYYNEYEGVTYEVTYDIENKEFFVVAYNTDYSVEDIKKFAYDFLYNILTPDDGVFTGYTINIDIVDYDF
jgi:predicted secreted protein